MISVFQNVITNKSICISLYKVIATVYFFVNILFVQFRVSWSFGDNRSLFLKLKTKLELCHVVLTTPKCPPKNLH